MFFFTAKIKQSNALMPLKKTFSDQRHFLTKKQFIYEVVTAEKTEKENIFSKELDLQRMIEN